MKICEAKNDQLKTDLLKSKNGKVGEATVTVTTPSSKTAETKSVTLFTDENDNLTLEVENEGSIIIKEGIPKVLEDIPTTAI